MSKQVFVNVSSGISHDILVQTLQGQLTRQLRATEKHVSSFLSSDRSLSSATAEADHDIGTIQVSLAGAASATSDDESYHLTVSDKDVELTANTTAGLFNGAQTLKQLIASGKGALPRVTIYDAPRFGYRGVMLDTARHFFTADNVKSMLQTMSSFKLNRLHLHLTDDQGWRLPIEGHASLTEIGADGVNKGSYSEMEISEMVETARAHNVELIPEVDVPGHVQGVVASDRTLGNTDVPGWAPPEGPSHEWGVHDYTLAPTSKTMSFLSDVFHSVHKLFPGKYVHIGGDEVKTDEWRRSPQAAASASLLGLDTSKLQVFFNRNVSSILENLGRRPISWDESQHIGGLPDDAVIMGWRSPKEVELAAKKRDVINANADSYYLDHYQGPVHTEPKAICCHTSLKQVYHNDPMPSGLLEDQQKHVLGGQVQLWSEYFPNWKHVEYMAFPRALAAAERFWTRTAPGSILDFDDFVKRLRPRLGDLDAAGVNYRPLDGHLSN